MFGVLRSYYFHYHHRLLGAMVGRFAAPPGIFGALSIKHFLLLDVETSAFVNTFGFSLLYLGFGSLMLSVLFTFPQRLPAPASLPAWFGVHSYSMYLLHMPVRRLGLAVLGGLPPQASYFASLFLYAIASIAVGYTASRLVEAPLLRLRDHIIPSIRRSSTEEALGGTSAFGSP
jgi:peptidoglycan/LPS O-acetylase OafA/YrhL